MRDFAGLTRCSMKFRWTMHVCAFDKSYESIKCNESACSRCKRCRGRDVRIKYFVYQIVEKKLGKCIYLLLINFFLPRDLSFNFMTILSEDETIVYIQDVRKKMTLCEGIICIQYSIYTVNCSEPTLLHFLWPWPGIG